MVGVARYISLASVEHGMRNSSSAAALQQLKIYLLCERSPLGYAFVTVIGLRTYSGAANPKKGSIPEFPAPWRSSVSLRGGHSRNLTLSSNPESDKLCTAGGP